MRKFPNCWNPRNWKFLTTKISWTQTVIFKLLLSFSDWKLTKTTSCLLLSFNEGKLTNKTSCHFSLEWYSKSYLECCSRQNSVNELSNLDHGPFLQLLDKPRGSHISTLLPLPVDDLYQSLVPRQEEVAVPKTHGLALYRCVSKQHKLPGLV